MKNTCRSDQWGVRRISEYMNNMEVTVFSLSFVKLDEMGENSQLLGPHPNNCTMHRALWRVHLSFHVTCLATVSVALLQEHQPPPAK
jgi:hypothetical protein